MKRNTLVCILSLALAAACLVFALVRDEQPDIDFELTAVLKEIILDDSGSVIALLVTDTSAGTDIAVDVRSCDKAVMPSGRIGFSHLPLGETLYISVDMAQGVTDTTPPMVSAELVMLK